MSLPSPTSPSGSSSAASDSSNGPHTPITPLRTSDLLPDSNPTPPSLNSIAGKRKPSRRANTAERRATHNAVERQRRETLNGRFLDLAALLPNLSQIRRPSKSAIVNSSIAHIHASRRHRLVAARELRLLKHETDALRRELNEWRDRSGLPRVEEPVRDDGFALVLSGEVEVVVPTNLDDDEGMGDEDGEDDLHASAPSGTVSSGDDMDDMAQAAAVALLKPSGTAPPTSSPLNQFAHNVPPFINKASLLVNHAHSSLQSISGGLRPHPAIPQLSNGQQHTHISPQRQQVHGSVHGGPMIANNPSTVSHENPAIASLYDGSPMLPNHLHAAQYGFDSGLLGFNQLSPQILAQLATGMDNKADSGWYNTNMGQFTPSTSSNGGSPVDCSFGIDGGLANGVYSHQYVYADDGRESVGNIGSGRERSSSFESINRGSPVGNFEFAGAHNMSGIPRWMGGDRMGDGLQVGPGMINGSGYAMMM